MKVEGETRGHLLVSLLCSLVLVLPVVSSRQQRRQARLVHLGRVYDIKNEEAARGQGSCCLGMQS